MRLLSSVVLGASPADTVLVRGTLHVNASLAFAQNALWKAGALVTGTQGARFERRVQPQKAALLLAARTLKRRKAIPGHAIAAVRAL